MYYVYVYLDPRKRGNFKYTNISFECEPFYVGKGKADRFLKHLTENKRHYKNNKIKAILNAGLKPIIVKLYENLNEEDSFIKEMEVIKIIGRLDLNLGPLTNLTDGGEGHSGYKHSNEFKEKQSLRWTLHNPLHNSKTLEKMRESKKGKILTDEHKQRISDGVKFAFESNPDIVKRKNDGIKNARDKISNSVKKYQEMFGHPCKGMKLKDDIKNKIRLTLLSKESYYNYILKAESGEVFIFSKISEIDLPNINKMALRNALRQNKKYKGYEIIKELKR